MNVQAMKLLIIGERVDGRFSLFWSEVSLSPKLVNLLYISIIRRAVSILTVKSGVKFQIFPNFSHWVSLKWDPLSFLRTFR